MLPHNYFRFMRSRGWVCFCVTGGEIVRFRAAEGKREAKDSPSITRVAEGARKCSGKLVRAVKLAGCALTYEGFPNPS